MSYGSPPAPGHLATDVMWRRVGGWVVDAGIITAVYLALFFSFAEQTPVPDDITCSDIQDSIEEVCIDAGTGDVYLVEDSEAVIALGVTALLGISIGGIMPGLTGFSPGKAIAGIRVVRADGHPTGIGRGLLRWLVSIVDAIPFCIPMLVGFIVAMTSDRRQRLADKAVGSYVVRSSAAGRPLDLPGGPPGWGGPPSGQWGAPAGQPWGAPPPAQWGAPPPGQWGAPPPQAPPPGWGPPGGPAQYPPAQYPPAQYPPAQYPPAQYPPGQYPPPPSGGWQPPADPSQGGWGSR